MSIIDRSKPIVLVHLAGGVQGSAVVRAALARGFSVRALVRDRGRAPAFPVGVEVVEADLDDRASLRAAGDSAGCAVLQIPTGPLETMLTRAQNAVDAWVAAGRRPLVLKLASASRSASCEEPSFVANASVEEMLRQGGLRFSSVRPTMYLDNLLKPSARAEIVADGIFAPPIPNTQRIAWTSADDCARAAVMLLERGAVGDHRIAGAQSLGGDELAAQIAAGLQRPIVYRAQPIEDFEQEVDLVMGEGMGRRIASKFRYFARYPEEAHAILAQPFEPHGALLDFKPTSVRAWVYQHRHDFVE